MKRIAAVSTVFLLSVLARAAVAEDGIRPSLFSGSVGVDAKYESNVDLLSADVPSSVPGYEHIDDARTAQVTATLAYHNDPNAPWQFEASLFGLSDVFVFFPEDTWFVGRASARVGYAFGTSALSLTEEARYYTEPDDTDFDNLRSVTSIEYLCEVTRDTRLSGGYQFVDHLYPHSSVYDYRGNGGFLKWGQAWTPNLSTLVRYDLLYLTGRGEEGGPENVGAPSRTVRHMAEAGLDALLGTRNALAVTYDFATDSGAEDGVTQVGEIHGEDENIEPDAEFGLTKHSLMVVDSHRLGERYTLSIYARGILKDFQLREMDWDGQILHRRDTLLAGALWLQARLYGEWYAKVRYQYLTDISTLEIRSFQDHIVALGTEVRF